MKLPKLDKQVLSSVISMRSPTLQQIKSKFMLSEAEAQRYLDIYDSREDLIYATQTVESSVGEFKKTYLMEGYKFVNIDEKTVNGLMGALAIEGSFRVMSEILKAIDSKDAEMVRSLAPLQLGMMAFMKLRDK